MSSKNSANKKIALKHLDTSSTRKKTQKMQLRKMDRSMKAITQLLKSPNTSHLQAPPKKLPHKSSDTVHLQLSQKNLPETKLKAGLLQVSPIKIKGTSLNPSQLQYLYKKATEKVSNHSFEGTTLKKSPEKCSNAGNGQASSRKAQEKSSAMSPAKIIVKKNCSGQLGVSPKNGTDKKNSINKLLGHVPKIAIINSDNSEKSSRNGHLQHATKKVEKIKYAVESDKSPMSSDIICIQNENEEYYPNKFKRNVVAKTISMKSNYNMKVIAGTNKRKLRTPQKGIKSSLAEESIKPIAEQIRKDSPIHSSQYSGLDISEVVRLIEDTQSLNDEDFLEILTCPSPVWWEDPPDEQYVEDSISIREPTLINEKTSDTPDSQTDTKANIKDPQSYTDGIKIKTKHADVNFMKKRKKLEDVLGTLKNKANRSKEIADSKFRIKRNSDSTEGSTFSDISVSEDELLRDLENLNIPIKTECNNTDDNQKIDADFETEEGCKDKDGNVEDKRINLKILRDLLTSDVPTKLPPLKRYPKRSVVKIYSPKSTKSSDDVSNTEDTISDTNVHFIDDDEYPVNDDTKDNGKIKYESNDKQVFVGDDNKKLVTVSKDTESMNDFEDLIDTSEFITVFKIKSHNFVDLINGDTDICKVDDLEASVAKSKDFYQMKLVNRKRSEKRRNNGKMNTFFKKRKKSQTSPKLLNTSELDKAKDVSDNVNAVKKCDVCNLEEKTYVAIPDSTKKLCLYCSSIFDDVCRYCVKVKGSERKVSFCKCERERKLFKYQCVYCKYSVNAREVMRRHLLRRHDGEVRLNGPLSNSYTCTKHVTEVLSKGPV